MNRFIRKATIILTLVSVTGAVFADRGTGKKNSKVKTNLNISTASSLKASILSSYKNGLSYKGSFTINKKIVSPGLITANTLTTYQKGNTTYIIPFKNKLAYTPDMKQGYTGVKLILRSN